MGPRPPSGVDKLSQLAQTLQSPARIMKFGQMSHGLLSDYLAQKERKTIPVQHIRIEGNYEQCPKAPVHACKYHN